MSLQGTNKSKATKEEKLSRGRLSAAKHRAIQAATRETLTMTAQQLAQDVVDYEQAIKSLKEENEALIAERDFQRWFLEQALLLQAKPTLKTTQEKEENRVEENDNYNQYLTF